MEDIIFSIISYGGDAKALAYEAIEASESGDFEKAQVYWQKQMNL